jgi:hypothetical protein
MSDVSCFTESAAVLKISRYVRRQISYYGQHELIIIIKTKKAFVPIISKVSFFTESAAVLKNILQFQKANIPYRKNMNLLS